MNQNSSAGTASPEAALVQHLQRMLQQYQQLNQLADRMLEKQRAGATLEDELQVLDSAKQNLAPLETELVALRADYLAGIRQPTDHIQRLTHETAACLKEVIEKIAILEQATKLAHQKLAPVINQSLRAAQMNQAYGNQS
jgi:recombinational DNA repair ATPase RecF